MITVNDLSAMTVLVTGGTRGIGLATALAFAARGAQAVITHRWGTVPEDTLNQHFSEIGAKPPIIVECDVADRQALPGLLDQIGKYSSGVDVFVSNVAYGHPVSKLGNFKIRGLNNTIERSLWPIVSYTNAIGKRFGRPPSYILGISSYGHLYWTPRYDLIAASKSALETMASYLAMRLYSADSRVNIIRAGLLDTRSSEVTLGRDFIERIKTELPQAMISAETVADCVVALCSGLMDSVTGQVIDLDNGCRFSGARFIEKQYDLSSLDREAAQ